MESCRLIATLAVAITIGLPGLSETAEARCVVYQHRDFKGASFALNDGDSLQMGGERCGRSVSDGSPRGQIRYNSSWNDQVSSFKVSPGCQITLWQHVKGCGGSGAHFKSDSSYSYVGSKWNDITSWVDCWCKRRR